MSTVALSLSSYFLNLFRVDFSFNQQMISVRIIKVIVVHLFTLASCCELSPEPFHEALLAAVGVDLLEDKLRKDGGP